MKTQSVHIEICLSPDQKAMIERAAAYLGSSVPDFVLGKAVQAAREITESQERIQLDRIQSYALAELLLTPLSPNRELREAAKQHRTSVASVPQ